MIADAIAAAAALGPAPMLPTAADLEELALSGLGSENAKITSANLEDIMKGCCPNSDIFRFDVETKEVYRHKKVHS